MRKSDLLLKARDIRALVEEKGYCLYMPGRDELVLSSEIESILAQLPDSWISAIGVDYPSNRVLILLTGKYPHNVWARWLKLWYKISKDPAAKAELIEILQSFGEGLQSVCQAANPDAVFDYT